MTAGLPPACDTGCPDGDYWRHEALTARAEATTPVSAPLTDAYSPPLPGDLLAYDDGPLPMSVGDRLLGLAVLAPWCWAVWGWSVGVVAGEVVRVVRGR